MATISELMQLALAHHQGDRRREAEQLYREILAAEPTNADAWHLLGVLAHEAGKHDVAEQCIRLALQLKPELAAAHYNLANLFRDLRRVEEALGAYRRAIELKPDYAAAFANLGMVHYRRAEWREASRCFEEAIQLEPELAEARFNRSLLLLLRGDFSRGWPEHEWRWKRKLSPPRAFAQPLWNGDPLAGKTLLIHTEQGLGDTIQFVRYVALIQQQPARVYLECQPALVPLLSQLPVDRLIPQGDALPAFDVHAPLLSLPGIFKTTLTSIPAHVPYLRADSQLVERWRQRLQGVQDFKIAIGWQGNSTYCDDRERSFELSRFSRIAETSGVKLISLQKGQGVEQLGRAAFPVLDFGSELDQAAAFMDSAAIMQNVQLVITSDSALAHLAGALGVPVWVALPFVPDWRWLLDRPHSPWYPTMRLFRQRQAGDWLSVFEEMRKELEKLV